MKKVVMVGAVLAGVAAIGWAGLRASPADENRATSGEKVMFKAVVHVNFADADQQKHGLKNVSNMLKAEGGKAEIVVVCHGSGIGLLVKGNAAAAKEVERLMKDGVRFAACENTMREKSIPKGDLLPGVTTVPSGAAAVVRKQQDGFGHFKP